MKTPLEIAFERMIDEVRFTPPHGCEYKRLPLPPTAQDLADYREAKRAKPYKPGTGVKSRFKKRVKR